MRRKLRTISGNDSSIDFWFQGLMIAPASIPRGGRGAVDLSKKNPTTSMCDSQSFGFGTRCLDHIFAKGTYGTTGKRRRIGREVRQRRRNGVTLLVLRRFHPCSPRRMGGIPNRFFRKLLMKGSREIQSILSTNCNEEGIKEGREGGGSPDRTNSFLLTICSPDCRSSSKREGEGKPLLEPKAERHKE